MGQKRESKREKYISKEILTSETDNSDSKDQDAIELN